jgi:FixJ family two-component response regulator
MALASTVRTEFPALPIILISGFTDSVKNFDFVQKPFLPATFYAAVTKLLAPANEEYSAEDGDRNSVMVRVGRG